ncbi:Tat pathway signal sequence domain protein [Streptomyces sp. NPDC049887]|uniref:Tat pathway signal sequence domain protein n=1 Tax=unclassified Streptomyces TaxID=2593676 RepID=UPI0034224EBD
MRTLMRRHLGKLVAGTAIAVTGTAAMVAVTLPDTAGARAGQGAPAAAGQRAPGEPHAPPPPGPGVVAAAPAEGKRGTGRDPLTDDELERARRLAAAPAARTALNAAGDRGPQHLSADLAESLPSEAGSAAPPRRAVVSYYDYRTDRLVTTTVDVTGGKVESRSTRQGVQPSPVRAELREAVELILASPHGAGLRADYRDATGADLTTPAPLTLSGYAYRKEREARVPPGLRSCGVHRCVRVVTRITGGPWIDTRDLAVDLSARTVVVAPSG